MKNISFRNYNQGMGPTPDYQLVHDFLVESGCAEYTYARFDWMINHKPYLEDQYLSKIGLWFNGEHLVAASLFDTTMDDIFIIALENYSFLYQQMLDYAKENMVKAKKSEKRFFIEDKNRELQTAAEKCGLKPTECKAMTACFYCDQKEIKVPALPEGYSLVSLADEYELEKLLLCFFKGFDHEANGEIFNAAVELADAKDLFNGNHADLNLKLSVKAPDGSYAAHCGMWYDPTSKLALIEPVATVPEHRRKGLAKVCLMEGIRRVKALGAERVYVGSNQQFYFNCGLIPYSTGSYWV